MSNRLEVIDTAKSFGGVLALSEATLTAESKKILAIIGPNGAGKTTLINVVSGVYPPDEGRVLLNGTDITGRRAFEVARHGIARTFQNVALFAGMSVLDNILLGRSMLMRSGVLKCGIFWGAARREEIRAPAPGGGGHRLPQHHRHPHRPRGEPPPSACRSGWSSGAPSPRTPRCCSSTNRWGA